MYRTPFLTYLLLASAALAQSLPAGLRFHASFDGSTDARTAGGDKRLYSAASYKEQAAAQPGLAAAPDVSLVAGAGRHNSGALRFATKNGEAVFYQAKGNVNFNPKNWTGTIAFFLKLDPETDLAPGYCDPIQVTDKAYNDSAIWTDFTKDDMPRHFRLGVFGALKAWNPNNIEPDKNPAFNNRLVVMKKTPFARDRWTSIVVTHSGLGGGAGRATLYADGVAVRETTGIGEAFEWDPAKGAIRLGVAYVGLMDDVMIFDRVITAAEVKSVATGRP
ncbi:MAG: LamG domain-containing protein [Acidobacteria bacterium]|nr:LamG domain-containing protein [Acidobacteriota bacterium]